MLPSLTVMVDCFVGFASVSVCITLCQFIPGAGQFLVYLVLTIGIQSKSIFGIFNLYLGQNAVCFDQAIDCRLRRVKRVIAYNIIVVIAIILEQLNQLFDGFTPTIVNFLAMLGTEVRVIFPEVVVKALLNGSDRLFNYR